MILEAEREEPRPESQPIKVAERKPSEPVADKTPVKKTEKEEVTNGEHRPDPFFGRLPDDPGVRDPATGEKAPEKASFRLF